MRHKFQGHKPLNVRPLSRSLNSSRLEVKSPAAGLGF